MNLKEMPKAYKNNGVCNIILSTPNRNSLKGKVSSIRQLHSSMHSREHRRNRGQCGLLPFWGDAQPNIGYYKALPNCNSHLKYKPPTCSVNLSAFLCMFVCIIKYSFSFSPDEPMLTRLSVFACIRIAQTKELQCLSPKIEQRNTVCGV